MHKLHKPQVSQSEPDASDVIGEVPCGCSTVMVVDCRSVVGLVNINLGFSLLRRDIHTILESVGTYINGYQVLLQQNIYILLDLNDILHEQHLCVTKHTKGLCIVGILYLVALFRVLTIWGYSREYARANGSTLLYFRNFTCK